jgi:hypothetical protein
MFASTLAVFTIMLTVALAGEPSRNVEAHGIGQEAGPAKTQRLTACTVLTPAEIKKLVGKALSPGFDLVKPNEEKVGSGTECFHAGVMVQLDGYPVGHFEATRQSYEKTGRTKFQPSGIADAAYFYEQDPAKSSHAVGIFAKTGQHVLTITMDVNPPATAESLRPVVIELTKAAVAKLK